MANDVFAGRRGFLRCFRESLFALATDQKESKGFKGKRQKDFQVSFPQLFMVCGEAGWGKSALVRRCIALAAEVEAETKKEFKTIVVDFDDPLFTRNILPFTPRMMVQYLHAVLVDPSLNLEDCFSEYASVEQRLEKVIAGVNALHRDEWL
ncbi:MAG TPA: hypothetical protein VKF42_07625, partial [Chitinivibrionales bacterium]|nr:hypothetical protein [Chitinivibrionales bacterium]